MGTSNLCYDSETIASHLTGGGEVQMHKYLGNLDQLKFMVGALGFRGAWTEIPNGHQFRAENGAILNCFSNGTLQFQGSREAQEALQTALLPQLGRGGVIESGPEAVPAAVRDAAGERERIFVVHGHDRAAREQLELILHRLDLDPFVLANTGGGGLTIIEALEREIGLGPGGSHFGIVLMTPDDFGYSREDGPARAEPRARQNVVLEMGMLLVALGRPNVAILKKGHVEVPSDAQGIIYIPFNDHVREAVPRLVDRLREAGFDLDPRAITRASA